MFEFRNQIEEAAVASLEDQRTLLASLAEEVRDGERELDRYMQEKLLEKMTYAAVRLQYLYKVCAFNGILIHLLRC